MPRTIIWISVLGLALAAGCSRDDAQRAADSAKDAAAPAVEAAGGLAEQAGAAADRAAGAAKDLSQSSREAAAEAAGAISANPVSACRTLAEQGAWDRALEVCKKAHEMMPDDPALEHAYQQARAASQ